MSWMRNAMHGAGWAVLMLMIGPTMFVCPALAQQASADEKAAAILNSARQAYNDRNFAFAADRYRAYLNEFGGRKEAPLARYGLALVYIEGPDKNFNAAIEQLQNVVGLANFPERARANYYMGLAWRAQGMQILSKPANNPNEVKANQNEAKPRFERALPFFATAVTAFSAAATAQPAPKPNELPTGLEWANRARCDEAEMLMRLNRPKEALALLSPWMKDPSFAKSRYRTQGIYLLGYASFALKDYMAASKALATLAPFTEPAIGVHARYLLARAHHLAGERPEAVAGYEAVLAGYANERKAAEAALKNPKALSPDEKSRLESLMRDPPPDYVADAGLYLGALLYEHGRFADAQARFATFIQQSPRSPLIAEARLRMGVTHIQLRQFGEGINLLNTLQDHPQLADQALLWIARAQIASADPNNAAAVQNALNSAVNTLRRAIDKAQQMSGTDPEAKLRRFEMLIELADTQQRAKQFREAAAGYQRILQENPPAEIAESAMQRQAVAMQLGGMYRESDEVCQRFMNTYPKSDALGEIRFRYAENAYLLATSLQPNQQEEAKRLYGEAIKRYQLAIDKYPDSSFVNLARQGMGTALYQLGQYEAAAKALSAIPEAERTGELATVSYLLADCQMRALPAGGDDALSMAKLVQALTEVSERLTAFIGAQEGSPLPQGPDAMIKLGYCLQRIAALTADPAENKQIITRARVNYATFLQKYPNHPLTAVAIFEDAKCLAQLGDFATAASQLSRFQNDPLKKSPLAPLAMIRYGDYLRQRKPGDAVAVLQQVRNQYESTLLNDPERRDWVPTLQFAHAMAMKESGKPAEARALFENIARQFAGSAEAAEAVWRAAQTRKDEATAKLEAGRKALLAANNNPQQVLAARELINQATNSLREAADYLASQAGQFANKENLLNLRLRMMYESAWVNRTIAEAEIDAAREKIVLEQIRKQQERMKIANPQPTPQSILAVREAEIPLMMVPLQPAERKMRQQYQAIIDAGTDAPLANDARFELGDQLARREEYDAAIPLLRQVLESDVTPDQIDRARLRLGGCFLGKNDAKSAAECFNAILQNPRGPFTVHARYGLGECCMILQDWSGAVQQLRPFLDNDSFRSAAMTSDRAVLRLGNAYAQLGQWDASRRTFEAVVQRFPYSPWVNDARYGMGMAWQSMKNYDQAINVYNELLQRTGSELAAKAQLQIGLCRMQQKKYKEALDAFLAVVYAFDYPELTPWALCEAARAQVELQQPAEAKKLLARVIKDNPAGRWNEEARKLLSTIK